MAEGKVTLNQIAAMVENVQDNVKQVAEGHQVIRSEIKQMEGRLTERIGENKAAIQWAAKDLGRKIDENKQKIEENGRKLDEHILQPAHQ